MIKPYYIGLFSDYFRKKNERLEGKMEEILKGGGLRWIWRGMCVILGVEGMGLLTLLAAISVY